MKPLGTRLDLELDELSFCQRFEPIHLNRGEMHEDILAAVLFNEAVAFGIIEPLYLPSGHASCLLRGGTRPHKTCAEQTTLVCGALYRSSGQCCQEKALQGNVIPRETPR